MAYLRTLFVLLRKNFRLVRRDYASLAIQVLSTLLAIFILWVSQQSFNNNQSFTPELREDRTPEVLPMSVVPRCIPLVTEDCYTLAYVPAGNPDVARYVDAVRADAGIPEEEVRAFESTDVLNAFLVDNPNKTQAAYVFEDTDIAQLAGNNVSFTIQVNLTSQDLFPLDATDYHQRVVAPAMVHAMNKVIMEDFNTTLDITYSQSVFPHPELLGVQEAFSEYGPLLLYGVFFISFVLFLYKIVDEKERGLRDYMKLSGLTQIQHYVSWAVPFLASFLLSTLLIILWGTIFRFKFFSETNFFVYFLTLWIFGYALTGWVFLFEVFTNRSQQVALFAFNFFIFSYLLGSAGSIVYIVDADGEPIVGNAALRNLFAVFPPVMFIKALNDTAQRAATGFGLTFASAATYTDMFPVRDCWTWMLCSGTIAFLVAMYLDNVVPTANGTGLSPLYLFKPSYWNFGRTPIDTDLGEDGDDEDDDHKYDNRADSASVSYDGTAEDIDVRRERERVASGARDHRPLVIKNLAKRYGKFRAVDDISFSVPRNSVTSILGPNGSGKSTTIKMLSTSLAPTDGDAFMYGRSVRTEQDAIRKFLGICPQFDIYWELLTAAEHIELFATLKGMSAEDSKKECERRLHEVGLWGAKDRYAGSFSGGMQRRMSVCLALTGDPAIVMLDECTTGTDPVSRRDLWKIIETAKRNRVVVLVTHSMEEAESLSDQILILSGGKVRVLGTGLHLKNKFGAGYRVSVATVSKAAADAVGEVISQESPAPIIAQSAVGTEDGRPDCIIAEYELPRHMSDEEMTKVVRVLESRTSELEIARFSVNHTDLDTVFKRIAALSKEAVAPEEDQNRRKRCGCC